MKQYPKGSVWVFPPGFTQKGTLPDGTPNMVVAGRPYYIIITKDSHVERNPEQGRSLFKSFDLHYVSLKSTVTYVEKESVDRYVIEPYGLCRTWFLGTNLKPLTDATRPDFVAALQDAMRYFKEREQHRREQFKNVCETVGMWPLPV